MLFSTEENDNLSPHSISYSPYLILQHFNRSLICFQAIINNNIQFSVFPAHTIFLTITLKRQVKTNDERKKTYFKANGVNFSI